MQHSRSHPIRWTEYLLPSLAILLVAAGLVWFVVRIANRPTTGKPEPVRQRYSLPSAVSASGS
ncbi:MAG: hypothetical protein FJX77_02725 [Armatimonadetes bacterium]|nr:hypothetical protein [Armatimonadota bacterium]